MFTIRPQPRSLIAGTTARVIANAPRTCTSSCAWTSAHSSAANGLGVIRGEALLTRTPTGPNSRTAARCSASAPASVATSACTAIAPTTPPAVIPAAISAARAPPGRDLGGGAAAGAVFDAAVVPVLGQPAAARPADAAGPTGHDGDPRPVLSRRPGHRRRGREHLDPPATGEHHLVVLVDDAGVEVEQAVAVVLGGDGRADGEPVTEPD